MIIKAIRTRKIIAGDSLFEILDRHIEVFSEHSILAVTSKIISICEGRIIPIKEGDKDELIKKEADLFLPKEENRYNLYLTIKNNLLAVSAGIDESNTNGYYVLWPKDPQDSANKIRSYLANRFGLRKVGVIITDGKTTPLRWGVTGATIAYSGFAPLNDLIGTPDVFGRKLKMTKVGVADGLAAAAVLEMGEGNEQTPLAIITDIPYVKFVDHEPSPNELSELKMPIEDDVYAPVLTSVKWQKGQK